MRAAYDGIYFDIRRSIIDGTYAYRDFLPSESALVNRYGCAHNTVRKALHILSSEGYVQPIHGKGVRVIYRGEFGLRGKRVGYDLRHLVSFKEGGRRHGYDTRTEVLGMESFEADRAFAERTGFKKGEQLLRLERIRYVDGRPLMREMNHFRADIVANMTREDAESSIYRFIEEELGHRLVTSKRLVTIEHACDRDEEFLDLAGADFLAVAVTCVFDEDGLLCEYTETHHHPDAFYLFQVTVQSRVS